MRALVVESFATPPAIREIATPEPVEGEVRVRVLAASVNAFDLAVIEGRFRGMMEHRFPLIPGRDFAGVVDAVGPDVEEFAPGDRVFGVASRPYLGDGTFAEFVTVAVSVGLARLPDTIGFTEGAALGTAGTAALAAAEAARLQRGQTVLVVGGTGGVGHHVIQHAVNADAYVIATAHSHEERNVITAAGASEMVDYTDDTVAGTLAARPHGVDCVFHLAGEGAPLVATVRPGGTLVSAMIESPAEIPAEGITVVPIRAHPTPETLARLAANEVSRRTRIFVLGRYPLEESPTALTAFAQGVSGKLVITME